jgi:hypothetical protein
VFVRRDLSLPQIVVQASHACIESAKAFLPEDLEHPHLVVLSAKDQAFLYKIAKKLDACSVKYKMFIEPDRDNEATSLATEPIFEDKRKIFKNYQCLKEKV